jgi:acetate kinase
MNVLVLNTGSSTVKFGLIASADERVLLDGVADWSARPAGLTVRRAGAPPAEAPLPAEGQVRRDRRVVDETHIAC